MSDSDDRHPLGTIDEIASSHSDSFTYFADSQEESYSQDAHGEEEEEFVYPGIGDGDADSGVLPVPSFDTITSPSESQVAVPLDSSDLTEYPSSNEALHETSPSRPDPNPNSSLPAQRHASPAQLEALYAAASSGDLPLLQRIINNALQTGNVESFSLVNGASSRTGLTALHAAASRGYIDIVKWLVEACGAIIDLEDREGETSLHKAALQGRLDVVQFLVSKGADVHAQDADGWTALHNACSKGYLDIVRWLCERGGAAESVDGVHGVDMRSKGGWTPLMNAASKGHLPIVLYLLTKQAANPLVRNNWGETAYDASAAVFEVWICEELARFEAEQWRHSSTTYDTLAVHTTVPLILYENQRLDTRLKTLAVSGGRPKFSPSGLGKSGIRPPFELKLLKPDESTGKKLVPAWRSAVLLPLREEPFKLPKPGVKDIQSGVERSHFWLSDWTLDVTLPEVDAETGWQYARSFDDPDDQWTAKPPARLERLLAGGSTVAALSTSGSGGSSRSRPGTMSAHSWVRRRRWVRVMRRRLDIPPLPFLGPDGDYHHWLNDGTMVPFEDTVNSFGESEGQELSAVPSNPLSAAQDYVARARYLAGPQVGNSEALDQLNSAVEARRAIANLERATTELRMGILGDEDLERKIQAEVLLNAYSRELERRRLEAGAQGLLFSTSDDDHSEDEDDDDDEFHYPSPSPQGTMRASARSFSGDYLSRQSTLRTPTDLTPHLSQASEFRVPTHEAPQKVVAPKYTPPTPHDMNTLWERDHHVQTCRNCQRRFSFLLRRHHCRRCGRIFCDRCSSYRVPLDPSEIVRDPTYPDSTASTSSQRVCQSCHEAVSVPASGRFRDNGVERIVVDHARLSVPNVSSDTSSQLRDLAECPLCSQKLAELGSAANQEEHVRNCLDHSPLTTRYLTYKLPGESPLSGVECIICFEEFVEGSMVARLSCFCVFHEVCLSSWLQRGNGCPIHMRDQ